MNTNKRQLVAWIVTGAILVSVLVGTAGMVLGTKSVEAAEAQAKAPITSLNEADAALIDKAKGYLKQISGLDIEFTDLLDNPKLGRLSLFANDKDGNETARVVLNANTGELNDFFVETPFDQLDAAIKNQLDPVLRELSPNRKFSFDKIFHIGKSLDQYTTMLQAGRYDMGAYGSDAWVRFVNKKIDSANFAIDPAQIDATLLNAAKQSLKTLGFQAPTPTNAFHVRSYRDYSTDTFRLSYGKDAEVEIGAKTLTVYNLSVNAHKDAVLGQELTAENKQARAVAEKKIKQLSNAQLLKSASIVVKKLYGIDLKGYSVSKKSTYVLFAKKGAPTLSASFNSFGAIYSLDISPIVKKID